MVVEDEVRLATLVSGYLGDLDMTCEIHHDGVNGLAAAAGDDVDVVVLDRMLPGMDGIDVCRKLRGLGHEVPVLMLTARGSIAERVEGPSPAAVVGMGINTLLAEDELPVPTATSLALAGATVDPGEVVREVLLAFERWYSRWSSGADLREAYAARCDTVGRQVRVVVSETESVEGEAVGVDPDGCLLVRTPDGVRAFAAGDIWHLR